MKHSECGLDCESCSEVPCPVANDDRDVASKFHAHLDNCGRCRNQPFNLCPIGHRLIQEAASELPDWLPNTTGLLRQAHKGEKSC